MGCCHKKSKKCIKTTVYPPTFSKTERLIPDNISLKTTENIENISEKDNKSESMIPNDDRNSNISNMSPVNKDYQYSLIDFEIKKTLGKGAYGKVVLVSKKSKNCKLYAMKIINKEFVKINSQYDNIKNEREILAKIDNPFVVKLCYAFQNKQNLYLLTEFIQGGELVSHLREKGQFKESWVKFYAAELITAIEDLHANQLIYRDLKPENILLDCEGHIKLIDFGLSKMVTSNENGETERTFSICGTPEYLAPEIINETGYDKSVDWWALGVLIYEMLSGSTPFYSLKNHMDISVYQHPVEMHSYFSDTVIDLLENFLQINPSYRLGNGKNGSENVKMHPFFKNINWRQIKERKIQPPIIPNLSNEMDVKHFSHSSAYFDYNDHCGSIRSKTTYSLSSVAESNQETDIYFYQDFYYDYRNKVNKE